MTSPSVGAPALKYGYVNTETPSPGEVKGLNNNKKDIIIIIILVLIREDKDKMERWEYLSKQIKNNIYCCYLN